MDNNEENKENEFPETSQQPENDEEIILVSSEDQPTTPKLPRRQTSTPNYQELHLLRN